MTGPAPARLTAPLLIAASGLLVAGLLGGAWLPAVVAFAAGLAAAWVARPATPIMSIDRAEEERGPPLPDAAALMASVDDPLLLVRNRRVLLANPAALAVLGEHIEGVDVRLAIRHPAAADQLADASTDDWSSVARPIELTGLGERDRRWEMSVALLPDGTRLVRLTDRSEAHASEQMRVDFVANASHELRTPLATLLGFVETLQDDDAANDPALRARFLSIMAGEATRMQRLVDDLISLSRIEAERFSLPRESVPLLPLAREVMAAVESLAEERGSSLQVEADGAEPVVLGDRAQLSQMLNNLVVNALKYGRAGTPVLIRFADGGPGLLQMSVIDQGEGIAPEHLPRLTERFYRVDPGRSRSMGGTGLGLAIVKHIIGRHRGRLAIDSRPGEGTQVHVFLPRADAGA